MSGWLVALAIIAAVNPPRLGPALPRGDRDAGERTLVAAAGALAAAVVLGLLVVLGGPFAQWLEVSSPTMAVAAGLVLVLAAIGQVVRAPRSEPALPDRRAALVPVAIPFVLRPEAGLLCLAAGAGGTGGWAALGLVGVVMGMAIAGRVEAAGTIGRVSDWKAWVLEAAAVACGIAITVDGVVSV